MFSTLRRDFQRYCESFGYSSKCNVSKKILVLCKSPGYWAIMHFRFGFWVNNFFGAGYKNPVKIVLKIIYFVAKQIVVYFSKIDVLVTADIGPGLFLSNKGNIILGLQYMGENCTIHHNVTTGQGVEGDPPKFGSNIWIGHDSIVYGVLAIGDNTIIESGTVLSKSLPGNMLVGGNPCRIRKKNIESGPYPVNF